MSQITNNYAPGSCVFQAGSSQNGDVHIENCTIYQGKTEQKMEGKNQKPGCKEEKGSEEEGSTEENPEEENPEEEPPLKRGIKNKFLFPQNGNESVKNGRLTQCEKRRFLHYLSKHSLDGRMLVSTRDDAINKAVVCFVRIWKEQELTASKPSGRAIFRFLTQDCGLKTEITIESYANKMNEWLKEKQQDVLTMEEVKRCFAGI